MPLSRNRNSIHPVFPSLHCWFWILCLYLPKYKTTYIFLPLVQFLIVVNSSDIKNLISSILGGLHGSTISCTLIGFCTNLSFQLHSWFINMEIILQCEKRCYSSIILNFCHSNRNCLGISLVFMGTLNTYLKIP